MSEDFVRRNPKPDWAGVPDWENFCDEFSSYGMLSRIRQSLLARLEGRNEGGDIEVMRLVDEIVRKEAYLHVHDDFALHCFCGMCNTEEGCNPACEGCEICRPQED